MLYQDESYRYMLEYDRTDATCPACSTTFAIPPDGDVACPHCYQEFVRAWTVHFDIGFARCPCGATTPGYDIPVNTVCGMCGARFLLGEKQKYKIDEAGEPFKIENPDDELIADGAYLPEGEEPKGTVAREIRCSQCGLIVYTTAAGFRPHPRTVMRALRGELSDVTELGPEYCMHCQERGTEVTPEQKKATNEAVDIITSINDIAQRAGLALSIAGEEDDDKMALAQLEDAKTMIVAVVKKLKALLESKDKRLSQYAKDAIAHVKPAFVRVQKLIKELGGK